MRRGKRPADFGFDRYDKGRLRRALQRVADARLYIRLKSVLLVAEGMAITAVAEFFEKSRRIVYHWIAAYLQTHNPQSLAEEPRSGRPPAAPSITDERSLEALNHNPLQLGYQTTVWTVKILTRHLSQCYECEISSFTLYRRMKKTGLRCKRPRYVYSEKDPNRTQKKGPLPAS